MKNKHKSLIWLLLFLKLIVSLQKISCINMKSSNHTVLFICLGNICRSPAAEGIMKAKVEEKGLASQFYIDSAAIGPWHVGQLPDNRMRRCGAAHGYCFDSHARQFDKSDFAKFDYIVVMDNDNYRAITRMALRMKNVKRWFVWQVTYVSIAIIPLFLIHIMVMNLILNLSSLF